MQVVKPQDLSISFVCICGNVTLKVDVIFFPQVDKLRENSDGWEIETYGSLLSP